MMIDESRHGTTDRKPSQVEDICDAIEKEIATLHKQIDQLGGKLIPIRCPRNKESQAIPDENPEKRDSSSPFIELLISLRRSISTEILRLQNLYSEIQI